MGKTNMSNGNKNTKTKRSELEFILKFFSYLTKYKFNLFLSIAFLTGGIISEISIPAILKRAVDLAIESKNIWKLFIFSSTILAAIIISSLNHYFLIYFTNKIGQNVIKDIRNELFSHILRLPLSYFDKNQSGRIVIRITNDVENLTELFISGLITFAADILLIIGISATLFFLDVKLAFITLSVFPAMIAITLFFRKKAREIYLNIRKKIAELNSFISESIIGIKTIKILPAYIFSFKRFRKLNKDYSEETEKAISLFSFFFSSIIFFSAIALGSIMGFGGVKILEGELSFGTFIAFWYAVNKLFDPIWDFSEKYNIVQTAIAASQRIFKILETETEEYEPKEDYETKEIRAKANKKIERGEIEFQNVSFSYDGEKIVLDSASFKINAGENVAIVGLTGAGKTTIANLILRMYKPQKGQILIDGANIETYPLKEIRRKIAIVHQDIFIFSRKVIENITFGHKNQAKIKEIIDILDELEIEIDLEKEVGDDGAGLSSGEKQIISILRAFYFDPKVIIFDEATAFIDPGTEAKILKLLEKIAHGKTLIKIAHRPSTIRWSGKIILVRDGKTHEIQKPIIMPQTQKEITTTIKEITTKIEG
jgi:ATP-binding cassette, subfamily B, multidrug efflux pump